MEEKDGTPASDAPASRRPASSAAPGDEQDAVMAGSRQASRANDRARVAAARVRTSFIVAAAMHTRDGRHFAGVWEPLTASIATIHAAARRVRSIARGEAVARIERDADQRVTASAFTGRRTRFRWSSVGAS